jgi:hypothetical protein
MLLVVIVFFDELEFVVCHPMDRRFFFPGRCERIFFLFKASRIACTVTADVSAGIKLLGREAEHTPSSNVEVKNEWSYIFTPPSFGSQTVHKDSFIFTFTT